MAKNIVAKQHKKKSNGFFVGLMWILVLVLLGFVAYRSILPLPSDRSKLYLVSTKFNGFQNRVYGPGQYYVSWQNLLPGNVSLLAVSQQVRELYWSKSDVLPSAQNYQALLPNLEVGSVSANPFSFRLGLRLRYRYRAEKLLTLALNSADLLAPVVLDNGPKSKGVAAPVQLGTVADELFLHLEDKLHRHLNLELSGLLAKNSLVGAEALEQYLKNILGRAFPELELLSLNVAEYRQPDLELYAMVKQSYQKLLQELSRESLENLLQQQNLRLDRELYLRNIERLGKILSEYPLLIQYFAVTATASSSANLEHLGPLKNLGEDISQKILQQVE